MNSQKMIEKKTDIFIFRFFESWEKILSESFLKVFKVCCVTSASEDYILSDDESQTNLIGNNETFEVIFMENGKHVEN